MSLTYHRSGGGRTGGRSLTLARSGHGRGRGRGSAISLGRGFRGRGGGVGGRSSWVRSRDATADAENAEHEEDKAEKIVKLEANVVVGTGDGAAVEEEAVPRLGERRREVGRERGGVSTPPGSSAADEGKEFGESERQGGVIEAKTTTSPAKIEDGKVGTGKEKMSAQSGGQNKNIPSALGPTLKGPPRALIRTGALNLKGGKVGNKVWKRSISHTSQCHPPTHTLSTMSRKNNDSEKEGTVNTKDPEQCEEQPSVPDALEKRGLNKLIVSRKRPRCNVGNGDVADNPTFSYAASRGNGAVERRPVRQSEEPESAPEVPPFAMVSGTNTWRRGDSDHEDGRGKSAFDKIDLQSTKGEKSSFKGTLAHGEAPLPSAKLFSTGRGRNNWRREINDASEKQGRSVPRGGRGGRELDPGRGRGWGRGGRTYSSGPVVKRIKLNESAVEGLDASHRAGDEGASVENKAGGGNEMSSKSKPVLTDFAYRETLAGGRGRGGRGRVGGLGGRGRPRPTSPKEQGRNMGLVRVKPDSATTPICPTFLRGIPCANERCRKRHDVPIEAATPICSFFQRNGQCLKRETCPFRHVKMNVRATICPSFALLGYCEDKDCSMKHVRVTGGHSGRLGLS